MNPRHGKRERTAILTQGTDPQVQVFSSIKYRMMQLLKMQEQSDLESLSKKLHISQMAVYKHAKELESGGLLEHRVQRKGVGRPRLIFRPSPLSMGIYPKGYASVAASALDFLQEKMGNEGVEEFFKALRTKSAGRYSQQMGDGALYGRTKRLASMRNAEGCMTEVKRLGDGGSNSSSTTARCRRWLPSILWRASLSAPCMRASSGLRQSQSASARPAQGPAGSGCCPRSPGIGGRKRTRVLQSISIFTCENLPPILNS